MPKSLDSDRSKIPVGEPLKKLWNSPLCNLCISDIRGVTTIMLLADLAATMLLSSPIIANGQQSDPIKVDETYSPYILILGIMAVIAAFLVLFIEPKLQRKEALKRGINTLKLALDDNRNDLLDKDRKFQIVDRKITRENSNGEQEIHYVNVYFDSDPYESVLHTGSFAQFCPKTQKALSTLHNALEIHNDLITYIDRYTDLYNIFHHQNDLRNNDFHYQERKAQYEDKVMELQKEILVLINTVERLIDEELKYNSIFSRDYCYKM